MTEIAIIGGGPAGMTAALYARRAGKSVLLFEKEGFGGQIVTARSVENFPGFDRISGSEFADRLSAQILAIGVQTTPEQVLSVVPGSDSFTLRTDFGSYESRSVILATGRRNRKLGLSREEELTGAGVSYCALCDGAFFKGKAVAVVGGGSTALQDALYLSEVCASVDLIHRRETFRGEAALVERLRQKPNVRMVLSSLPIRLEGSPFLTGVAVRNAVSGAETLLKVSGLFVAVGQEASNEFLRGTVALDEGGYVIAGEDTKTSCPGIFVAGDCRTKTVRQLTTAASDGTSAAIAACEYLDC